MFHRIVIALAVIVASVPSITAQEKTWQAGVAKSVITPREFMWMSGYGGRTKPAEGKVHDLWAKAIILQNAAGNRCVLVTMDLVGIDRQLSDEICAEIKKRHGFFGVGKNSIAFSKILSGDRVKSA